MIVQSFFPTTALLHMNFRDMLGPLAQLLQRLISKKDCDKCFIACKYLIYLLFTRVAKNVVNKS